jgi:ribulose-5-phosphate 4-epimerase/fuculose-1-phosphate aldolase
MTSALEIPSLKDKVSPEEWAVRVDLAASYRLVSRFGWEDLVFTHISARVPGTDDQFLINPYGLFFDEITASSLVKIDLEGKKIEDSPFPVNAAGFVIHSAIHAANHDAKCVLHTHTVNGVAVSAQHGGLLPLSQHSMAVLGSLGYHDFEGPATRDDEKPRLVADLGRNVHLILKNHGLLTIGETVAEAFTRMYYLEASCAIQVRAQAGGGELTHVSKEVLDASYATMQGGGALSDGPPGVDLSAEVLRTPPHRSIPRSSAVDPRPRRHSSRAAAPGARARSPATPAARSCRRRRSAGPGPRSPRP